LEALALKKFGLTWNWFEILWVGFFSALAVFITLYTRDSFIGFVAFFTGIMCVIFTAKGSILSFFWGYINILSYAWISWAGGFYGEVGLNLLFFLPWNIVGNCLWYRNIHQRGELEVRQLKWYVNLFGVTSFCIGGTLLLGWLLSKLNGQYTPYLDAFTTVTSVIAFLLMMFRYREHWLCWLIVDLSTLGMWAFRWYKGSPDGAIMVIMWTAYSVIALYGWYNWSRRLSKA
jgi:nicotinamide mononucleotide transporter